MRSQAAKAAPAERRVVYFPTTPADPYLAVVFGPAGEVVSVTPTPNWRQAEAALGGRAARS